MYLIMVISCASIADEHLLMGNEWINPQIGRHLTLECRLFGSDHAALMVYCNQKGIIK